MPTLTPTPTPTLTRPDAVAPRSNTRTPRHAAPPHAALRRSIGAIGDSLSYLDGKLPIAYVQLLALMAKFNMLLMAVTRGASVAMHAKGHGAATRWLAIVLEFTRLFFIPILYQVRRVWGVGREVWGVGRVGRGPATDLSGCQHTGRYTRSSTVRR